MKSTTPLLLLVVHLAAARPETPDFPRDIVVGALEPPLINGTGFDWNYFSYIQQDMLQWLRQPLGFNYTVQAPDDLRFGGFVDGRWNGVIGQLVRKEIDMGAAAFSMTHARSLVVDFTTPIFLDVTGILIPFPQEKAKTWASFEAYPVDVWLWIIGSAVCVSAAFWIQPHRSQRLSWWILFTFAVLMRQSKYLATGRHRARLIAAGWSLSVVVLIHFYMANLISILTVPSYEALVDSIEDVAAKPQVKFSTIRSTAVDAAILRATDGAFKIIGDSIRDNPEILVDNDIQGAELVLQGDYAYTAERKQLEFVVQQDFRKNKRCRFALAKKNFMERRICFPLVKGSPLRNALDRQILLMHQFGFVVYWERRYLTQKDACQQIGREVTANSKALTLSQLVSPFVAYFIGAVAAVLVFLCELLGRHVPVPRSGPVSSTITYMD